MMVFWTRLKHVLLAFGMINGITFTAYPVNHLNLRLPDVQRICAKEQELNDYLTKINRRRICTTALTATALCAGVAWLCYPFFYPETPIQKPSKKTKKHKPAAMDTQWFDAWQESQTFWGMLKLGTISTLTAVIINGIVKRAESAWEKTTGTTESFFSTFWGKSTEELYLHYSLSLLQEVDQFNATLQGFTTETALRIQYSEDKDLEQLLTHEICVAWEGLMSALEHFIAINLALKNDLNLEQLLTTNYALQNFMNIFNATKQFITQMATISQYDNTFKATAELMSKKLMLSAQQVIRHA